MAVNYKPLGQVLSIAATEVTVYTCPASTNTVVSSVVICNTGIVDSWITVYVVGGGGATALKYANYYELTIPALDTFISTIGITLEDGDKIIIDSDTSAIAVSVYGQEITP